MPQSAVSQLLQQCGQAWLRLPDGAATLLDPAALLSAAYGGLATAAPGQWGLVQPHQRPSQQAGQKRPAAETAAEEEQQLYRDIALIRQAHQQLLALLRQAAVTAEAAATDSTTEPAAEPAAAAEPGAAESAAAAEPAAAAAAKPAATAEPAAAAEPAAEQVGCDWRALAALRHVLKPQISFQYTDKQQQLQQVQSKLFGAAVHNPGSSPVLAAAHDRQVLLPARSCFCMSDLKAIHPFVKAVQQQGRADLLLIDPPWENASARRAAHYEQLTPNHLLYLPVGQLLKQWPGSLVALWMTNRPRHHRFVRDKLLPAWGLTHEATWFWLKVTDAGEAVSPLGALHRHPFEQLWLARPHPQQPPAAAAHPAAACQNEAEGGDHSPHVAVPDRHVVISVPGVHSRKPHLKELLLPHVAQRAPVVAELFARELFPGCLSWGDEALRFQEVGVGWKAADDEAAGAAL